MPPPRPLEGKDYGITLRPIRLEIDLEVGQLPRQGGESAELRRWGSARKEEGGDASE